MSLSNLPPGADRVYDVEIEVVCVNPDCGEKGRVHQLPGYFELGGCFLHDEDSQECPECSWERADPMDRYAAIDANGPPYGGRVIVDMRSNDDPVIIYRLPFNTQLNQNVRAGRVYRYLMAAWRSGAIERGDEGDQIYRDILALRTVEVEKDILTALKQRERP